MGLFQLDPQSIVDRVKATGAPARIPTMGESVLRGIVGFTIVSVAGFLPWILGLGKRIGAAGMYAACAAVFIGLCGPLLHRLILGPGSLSRFTRLFGLGFLLNSLAWVAAYMGLKGHLGSLVGLLAGSALMGGLFAAAFDERSAAAKSIAALFVMNTLGYYGGNAAELALVKTHLPAAMLLYGVCYGVGLGAGLGLAFHFCQKTARARLAASS
jgi:hypothetical protein